MNMIEKVPKISEIRIPIDQLDFQHLHWRENEDGTITSEINLLASGKQFELQAMQTQHEEPFIHDYSFSFILNDVECLQGAITMSEEFNQTNDVIECSIAKLKGSEISGRLVYSKMLDFLKTVVDQHGKAATHIAQYSPSYNIDNTAKRMTAAQWKEIFEPILQEHGYSKKSDTIWEKVYAPKSEQLAEEMQATA